MQLQPIQIRLHIVTACVVIALCRYCPYSYGPILLWLYMPYIGTAFMVMVLVTAYRATAYIDFALIAMAYIVTVYIVTACVNMVSIDTAPCSYRLNR